MGLMHFLPFLILNPYSPDVLKSESPDSPRTCSKLLFLTQSIPPDHEDVPLCDM